MQGLFERLKEKLVKAVAAPAQEELGNIRDMISSLQTTTKVFDSEETSKRLGLILENCNKWQIYIINESSTGLFFCESHNRKCIEAKCKSIAEITKKAAKRRLTLQQIERTNRQLEQLNGLSGEWCSRMSRGTHILSDRPQ